MFSCPNRPSINPFRSGDNWFHLSDSACHAILLSKITGGFDDLNRIRLQSDIIWAWRLLSRQRAGLDY